MKLKTYKVTLSLNPDDKDRIITVKADRVAYDAMGNLVFLIDSKITMPGQEQSTAIKTIRQWIMFDENPEFDA